MEKAHSSQRIGESLQARISKLNLSQVGLNMKEPPTRVRNSFHEELDKLNTWNETSMQLRRPPPIPLRPNSVLLPIPIKPMQYSISNSTDTNVIWQDKAVQRWSVSDVRGILVSPRPIGNHSHPSNHVSLSYTQKTPDFLPLKPTTGASAMYAPNLVPTSYATRIPLSRQPLTALKREMPIANLECNNNNHSTNNFLLGEICLACRDFSVVDAHAANYPRRNVSSIPNLSRDLCTPFVSTVDKARAIFTWLHHNIAYDTAAYFGNNVRCKSADETLRTGLAVCQGYAELFEQLARYSGLKAIVVSGHGKGYSYRRAQVPGSCITNHAWNAVELESGKWHLIDACWGAGYVDENKNFQKKFKPFHFTTPPETFRLKHYPANPTHQFCSRDMSWLDYITMQDGPLIYTGFEEKGFNEAMVSPCVGTISAHPTKFIISSKCPHTYIKPQDQYVLLLTVDGVHKPFQVDFNGTTWTCESNAIRQGNSVFVNYLENMGGRNGKGITVHEYERSVGRASMRWVGMCRWEVR